MHWTPVEIAVLVMQHLDLVKLMPPYDLGTRSELSAAGSASQGCDTDT
jgi:hypothetical protein